RLDGNGGPAGSGEPERTVRGRRGPRPNAARDPGRTRCPDRPQGGPQRGPRVVPRREDRERGRLVQPRIGDRRGLPRTRGTRYPRSGARHRTLTAYAVLHGPRRCGRPLAEERPERDLGRHARGGDGRSNRRDAPRHVRRARAEGGDEPDCKELASDPGRVQEREDQVPDRSQDRKSTRLNSSHGSISYAVFCLKKKNRENKT